jgi:hypothetical protein
MDDEQFDRLLREAAQSYNAPPPTPAPAIWAAVQARRAAATPDVGEAEAQAAPRVAPPAGKPALSPHAPTAVRGTAVRGTAGGRRAWRGAALAALAAGLVAVGVAIGRHTTPESGPPAGTVAAGGLALPGAAPDGAPATAGAPAASDPPAQAAPGRSAVAAATPRPALRPSTRRAAGVPAAGAAPPLVAAAPDAAAAASGSPYRATTADHLARAEALLTAFGSGAADLAGDDLAADGAPDAAWARDLLTTTRLLLDSPAARDPQRRRLFEDLELVLVQMARLAPADSTSVGPAQLRREREERALIDGTMRDVQVMPRLRRAIPAGVGS